MTETALHTDRFLPPGGLAEDAANLQELVPMIYRELRSLARANRHRWCADAAPGTTSLVHEAYIKLNKRPDAQFDNQQHFLCVASRVMRSILVDNARWHHRQKRRCEELVEPDQDVDLVSVERADELLALDEALEQLAQQYPELASVVECRSFGGLTQDETATALDISVSTVKRRWELACALLYDDISNESPTQSG